MITFVTLSFTHRLEQLMVEHNAGAKVSSRRQENVVGVSSNICFVLDAEMFFFAEDKGGVKLKHLSLAAVAPSLTLCRLET